MLYKVRINSTPNHKGNILLINGRRDILLLAFIFSLCMAVDI